MSLSVGVVDSSCSLGDSFGIGSVFVLSNVVVVVIGLVVAAHTFLAVVSSVRCCVS